MNCYHAACDMIIEEVARAYGEEHAEEIDADALLEAMMRADSIPSEDECCEIAYLANDGDVDDVMETEFDLRPWREVVELLKAAF